VTATPEAERSAQADGHLRRERLLAGCSHERIEREAGKALIVLLEQLSHGKSEVLADVKHTVHVGLNYFDVLRVKAPRMWAFCACAAVLDGDSLPISADPFNCAFFEVHA
jgi:hypothetical protein